MNMKQTSEMKVLTIEETHAVAGGFSWSKIVSGAKKIGSGLRDIYWHGNAKGEIVNRKNIGSGFNDVLRGILG